MATKQLPIDLKVLRVIAYRYKWMLIILTFLSFAFSAFIAKSMVNVYSASTTIFVDPGNVLGDITQGVAVTTSLKDQLVTLQHLILNDDFIEPHVIQELDIRPQDVYIPLVRLEFMPQVIEMFNSLKNMVKTLFGLEVYVLTDEQKQMIQRQEIMDIVKDNISLRQGRGSLMSISYIGPNPTACQKIVEIVANQCKEFLLRSKNQETREALRYIERQYNEATRKLEELERELAAMRVEQFDKGPEAKIALLQQRQLALDDIRMIEQDLADFNTQKQELLAAKAKRQTVLRQDPEIIAQLAQQSRDREALELEKMKNRRKQFLDRGFTDEWPEVRTLNEQIASQKNSLQDRLQEDPEAEEKIFLVDPIYNEYFRQIKQIETEQASLVARAKRKQNNIAIYEEKLKSMPEIEKSFAEIARKIGLHENLQLGLAERRETARATMELEKTRGENRIKIIGRSYSNKPMGISPIIAMGVLCLLGPGIGLGIIFLLYYLNTSVKSPEDVQIEYNLPVIAVIPKTNFKQELKRHKRLKKAVLKQFPTTEKRALTSSKEPAEVPKTSTESLAPITELTMQKTEETEIELFEKILKRIQTPLSSKSDQSFMVTMLTNPDSQASEEYRRLCFNIEWGLKESLSGPCKTIMVTSALPNEGKTITALNLASTLARNHKVLLVDANFRKPSIHKAFGIPQAPGLSDMLEHHVTPQLFFSPESSNLSILPAGMGVGHPADLLSSRQMHLFIESIKSSPYFEYAIFDVPAVTLIPDSSIIASKLDGIVWVVWELRTSKEIVRLALARITNPTVLGVVLNRSERHPIPKKYNKVWKEYQRNPAKIKKKRNNT